MLEPLSPYDLLRECTSAKATIDKYTYYLEKFLEFLGRQKDDYNFLLTLQDKELENTLIHYIVSLKRQGLSYQTISTYFTGIKKFYKVNDIIFNDEKVKRYFGEKKKTIKDVAYTHEEIQQMLKFCNERMKMIILLMSSTGMRLGAMADLRLKHMTKVETNNIVSYKFTIYENSPEEYVTFCTPECTDAIDTYLQYRKRCGEDIHQESPLLRENFDIKDSFQVKHPRPIKTDTIGKLIVHILEISGLRTPNKKDGKQWHYQRKTKSRTHGFRKFANTNMVRAKLDITMKERIIGHSTGLDDVYYTPEQMELYEEYTKAVNNLTINEENRLKQKVKEFEFKEKRWDIALADIAELKRQMGMQTTN